MKSKPLTPTARLAAIAKIIEDVENRCMAVDGPVTPTHQEITDDDLFYIYKLAKGAKRAKRK